MKLLWDYFAWVFTWIGIFIFISYLGYELGFAEITHGVPKLPPGCC